MANLILFQHISLDGYAASNDGNLDWVHVDDEMFKLVGKRINETDTAVYGRKTYEMMQAYWPTAADQPNASKHDMEHSTWYKKAHKVVLSRSMKLGDTPLTQVVNSDLVKDIHWLKEQTTKDILIFGSPTAGHALMDADLVDGYWFFLNPVLLGSGIPIFTNAKHRTKLVLTGSYTLSSGVIELRYTRS
jgi:dihydrofolate reductase